jgi:hypothetical protein
MKIFQTSYDEIKDLFITFFKKEPSWAAVAEADITFVAPVINTIVTLTAGPVVDAAVNDAIIGIQTGLVVATKFIKAEDSSKNLSDVLTNLVSSLQGLSTLSGIQSHPQVTKITSLIASIILEIETILKNLPV